jgi:hypothetical protein
VAVVAGTVGVGATAGEAESGVTVEELTEGAAAGGVGGVEAVWAVRRTVLPMAEPTGFGEAAFAASGLGVAEAAVAASLTVEGLETLGVTPSVSKPALLKANTLMVVVDLQVR